MKQKLLLVLLFASLNLSAVTIGEIPTVVNISNKDGGMVKDGSEWSSSSIKDKVYILFYVDPDKKDVNDAYTKKLKAKKYDRNLYGSIAIINLAATWKPNFIIESILKGKQEEFPDTIYVKDKNSVLVKQWGLTDNASDILIFDKNGKLLFSKSGALSEEDMQKSFKIIEANL